MRKLIIWAGLFTASAVSNSAQQAPQSKYRNDPRLFRLTEFFQGFDSPIEHLAADFLLAADLHQLDWRLLPSICVIESSAGKNFAKNNVFGWDSARRGFGSVRDGIYWVASRFAQSRLYRDKELDEILATYNPRPEYGLLVKSVMRQVDPTEPLRARCPVRAQINLAGELQSTVHPAPAQ